MAPEGGVGDVVQAFHERQEGRNRLCGAGRVTVNGRRAEPAAAVRAGDIIEVEVGDRRVRARVRGVPEGPRPDADYCEILDGGPPV